VCIHRVIIREASKFLHGSSSSLNFPMIFAILHFHLLLLGVPGKLAIEQYLPDHDWYYYYFDVHSPVKMMYNWCTQQFTSNTSQCCQTDVPSSLRPIHCPYHQMASLRLRCVMWLTSFASFHLRSSVYSIVVKLSIDNRCTHNWRSYSGLGVSLHVRFPRVYSYILSMFINQRSCVYPCTL
jgi:hypothetical protein